MFDTLSYVEALQEAGVDQKQARAHAKAFLRIAEERLATKDDLVILKKNLTSLEDRLTAKIDAQRQEIIAVENRLMAKIDQQGQEIMAVEDRLMAKIDQQGQELTAKIDQQGQIIIAKVDSKINKMILWLVPLLFAQTALVVTLVKLF